MSHTSWKLSFYLHNNKQPKSKIRDGRVGIRTGPAKASVGRMSTEDDEVELEHQRRGFTETFGNDFQRKAGSPTERRPPCHARSNSQGLEDRRAVPSPSTRWRMRTAIS